MCERGSGSGQEQARRGQEVFRRGSGQGAGAARAGGCSRGSGRGVGSVEGKWARAGASGQGVPERLPGAGGAASPAAPPGAWGSPGAAVPGRGAGGGREAAPIKGTQRAARQSGAAPAAVAMGMLSLPGFLSCGKKKVGMGHRAGGLCGYSGRYRDTWTGVGGENRQVTNAPEQVGYGSALGGHRGTWVNRVWLPGSAGQVRYGVPRQTLKHLSRWDAGKYRSMGGGPK